MEASTDDQPRIRLEYVSLFRALTWDWIENPKRHDLGGIITSIERYGFRDPPEYDGALDAFVQGNGRVQALAQMYKNGRKPPLYIGVMDGGEWAVPVLFGADARSEDAARAYAIDANNLVVTGGETGFWDIMSLYDTQQMAAIAALAQGPMVTLDEDVLGVVAHLGQRQAEPPPDGIERWTFLVEFEAETSLREELEELMASYFMPRSKRKMMPEFFTAMVRSYCDGKPAVIVE